jgi:hypothetical protein
MPIIILSFVLIGLIAIVRAFKAIDKAEEEITRKFEE